jgi:hypothetical protein
VQKLRKAMEDYENDKWRLIAAKIGSGFSPVACQEKAEELEVQEEYDEASSTDSPHSSSASLQPYTTMRVSSDPPSAISAPVQHYGTMSSTSSSPRAIPAPMRNYTTMGSSSESYPTVSDPMQHYNRMGS